MRSMAFIHKFAITLTSVGVAAAVYMAGTPAASACGCFVPPDPTVPIVQAGELIVFGQEGGIVTAHIQIQYSGDAEEFGWLVPLPSVPDFSIGSDELFAQAIATTQPKYRLNREYLGTCGFDPSRQGAFPPSDAESDDGANGSAEPESPLVLRDTVGPYDYAVLSAENKDAMLEWLDQERFFVPAGTDDVVDPYIRPGAYFLALKLRKGNSVGDLQPVVLKYQSELPMIPIVLTSVAANPDMGILVWVLGEHRAIPRNYFHTIINDAAIDWLNFGANYVDVITRAVDEADRHHSFVTEYAGTSSIMRDILDYQGRFGNLAEMRQMTDAQAYIEYMVYNGYAIFSNQPPFCGPQFSSQILSILDRHLPMPSALAEQGITPNEYYTNISWYLGWYRDENPELFEDLDLEFDPVALTDELEERVIEPILEAGQLFRDHPYMTRMFTTLSPQEMTRDPVFSYNPDLGDISNIHDARMVYFCGFGSPDQSTTPARLITEQGWELSLPDGEANYDWLDVSMPASYHTQVLREEGAAEVVKDNAAAIEDAIDDHRASRAAGCSLTPNTGHGGLAGLILLGLVAAVFIRRRR